MKFVHAIMPIALLFSAPVAATEQYIEGTAFVIDGDTLDFSGTRVRVSGIDAPETEQTCLKGGAAWNCGADAEGFLTSLVDGQQLRCRSTAIDVDGRLVASCTGDDFDIGLAMIEAGLATAFGNSPQHYLDAEALRKELRIGIWSSEFQSPADWRDAHPRPAIVAEAPEVKRTVSTAQQRPSEKVYRNSFGCAIKGNRNYKGEWIYHLPGREHYDKTRPEELFCTEAAAQKAGYRRSKA